MFATINVGHNGGIIVLYIYMVPQIFNRNGVLEVYNTI